MFKKLGVLVLIFVILFTLVPTVQAALDTNIDALAFARAIAADPSQVTGAAFLRRAGAPGNNSSVVVSDTPLTSFPTQGSKYGILSTGRALGVTPTSGNPDTRLGALNWRGDADYDQTVLKIDLNVPSGANCLSFNLQFFSREFPGLLDEPYHDAFIAELNKSTWTTNDTVITAPDNFAFGPDNKPLTSVSPGIAAQARANAVGTVFGKTFRSDSDSPYGATRLLIASTPIQPGANTLYLSIFDHGHKRWDAAAFLDNLILSNNTVDCNPGLKAISPKLQADPSPTVVVSGLVGRPIRVPVQMSNIGSPGTTLTVEQVSNSNPAVFNISGLPLSVVQGAAAQTVMVGCTPEAGPARTGKWVLRTNEAGNTDYTFDLVCAPAPQTPGTYRPDNATFYLKHSIAGGIADSFSPFGSVGSPDIPIAGDWNNDGIETIGLYRQTTGVIFLRDSNKAGAPVVYSFSFGQPGDIPVAGDWNGDAFDSLGVYRQSTGRFLLRNTLNAGPADYTVVFGSADDVPLAGDWNDDKIDSPAFWRTTTQRFFFTNDVCNCTATQYGVVWYGLPGDRPVVGDWNANGITGVGVFRPGNLMWYIKDDPLVGSFGTTSFQYGLVNDSPLAGLWVPGPYTLAPNFEPEKSQMSNNSAGSAPGSAPIFEPGK